MVDGGCETEADEAMNKPYTIHGALSPFLALFPIHHPPSTISPFLRIGVETLTICVATGLVFLCHHRFAASAWAAL